MFGFSKSKNSKQIFALFDCANANIQTVKNFPLKCGDKCDIEIEGVPILFEVVKKENGSLWISPSDEDMCIVNAQPLSEETLLQKLNTFEYKNRLFYIITDSDVLEEAKHCDINKWLVFHTKDGKIEDELPFARIKNSVMRRGLTGAGLAICPRGMDLGFFFGQVFDNADVEYDLNTPILANSDSAITCPLCWLKFDAGDAMSIAVHESLRGDPVLGEDAMLRFLPTVFNDDAVALDAAGMPCADIACPHCRKKLPPNYLELPQKIFSIVGAPSAGKSYYLSVLIRQLQNSLYKNFDITLKDLDPTGNILLTQMKNRLFSAKKPEEAILAKTALEGAMYERYPRFGKMVALPKPMTYSLSKDDKVETSLIFYDNAGEHFEPGLDIEESPGAMHVASSSAIFFLFDPASNRNFKNLLSDYPDPQLQIDGRLDQQDTILSEMEVRIKRILSLEPSKRIDTPLAVILGKCDIFKHLLKSPLQNPVSKNSLDSSIIDSNSEILREFLLEVDPSIVASVHSISSNVKYFALSALGHSPQVISDGAFAGKIAPSPDKISPIDVEIPTIWALSEITNLITKK